MRKISASLVCPISSPAVKLGVIVVESDGTIAEVRGPLVREEANVEYYNGILIPGFVNAHCHLELSHLKGVFPPSSGMAGFIEAITEKRGAEELLIDLAIQRADRFMYDAGINLVGDVSNGTDSLAIKTKSKIAYHTFAEAFSTEKGAARKVIEEKKKVVEEAQRLNLSASLTLHAPYSISPELVSEFSQALPPDGTISLHLFESREEIDYMEHSSGPLASLYTKQGRKEQPLDRWGTNPYAKIFDSLPARQKMLAIHGCNITQGYIDLLQSRFRETWFVLCPRSNLYIHNQLPPIDLIHQNAGNIALGTDSLASNLTLSILEEMKAIASSNCRIPFEEILKWATLNGALALGQEAVFGSFEEKKKPGVLLLTGIDIGNPVITEKTKVQRLI